MNNTKPMASSHLDAANGSLPDHSQECNDTKAEDSGLPGDAEKLRGNAQSEMPAPEHVPGPGNQKERGDVCDYQQAEFRRLEQSFVHVKQRPYQSKNRSYKKYSSPQTTTKTAAMAAN